MAALAEVIKMSNTEATLFTRIINREIPADIRYEDDLCIVINDIAPQAPVHMLVIPKQPIPRLVDASKADRSVLGHLMWVAAKVAREAGVDEAFQLLRGLVRIKNSSPLRRSTFFLNYCNMQSPLVRILVRFHSNNFIIYHYFSHIASFEA